VPGAGTAVGAMVGGAAGSFLGPLLFDALFGKKGGGGGGGGTNLNVGGGAGMAGYRVPTFVAQSAEAASQGALDKGFVLDEGLIEAELAKLGDSAGNAATDVDVLGDSAAAAALLVTGSLEDLASRFYQFSPYNKDDPTDPGDFAGAQFPGFQTEEKKAAEEQAKADALAAEELAERQRQAKRQADLDAILKQEEEEAQRIHNAHLAAMNAERMRNYHANQALNDANKTNEAAAAAGLPAPHTLGNVPSATVQEAIAMSGGAEKQSDYVNGDVGETQGADLVVNVSFIQQQAIEKAQAAKIGSAWAHVMYGNGGEEEGW